MSAESWTRLEPGGRVVAREGAHAKVADPLWLLGRQWQLGELTASDSGTPVTVRVRSAAYPIDKIHVGESAVAYRGQPLECVIEREPRVVPNMRERLRAGQLLRQQLIAANFAAAAATVTSTFAASSVALVRMVAHAIDAELVAERLRADGVAAVAGALVTQRVADLVALLETWWRWYEPVPELPSAWDSEQAEYRFSLTVPVEDATIELVADEYRGGRLDWDSFDARVTPATTPPNVQRATATVLATPVTFPNMPVPRFWEIEQGTLDLAGVDADLEDLATLLVVEFVLSGSDDWLVVPVDVKSPSLVALEEVSIACTFGTITTHTKRAESAFRMFATAGPDSLQPYMLAWSPLEGSVDGPTLEELSLGRDEAANVVWAVERIVCDRFGRPHERARDVAPPITRLAANPSYELAIPPPTGWLPMLERDGIARAAELVVGHAVPAPQTALLSGWPHTRMPSREIPRNGIVLRRAWQLAVDEAGARYSWIGRRKVPGSGDLVSGLRFDVLR